MSINPYQKSLNMFYEQNQRYPSANNPYAAQNTTQATTTYQKPQAETGSYQDPEGIGSSSVFQNPDYPLGGIRNKLIPDEMTVNQDLAGGSTSRSASRDYIYKPQDQFSQTRYYPYLNALYDAYSQDPGQLVAGFDPYQSQGQDMGAANAMGLQGAVGQTMGAFGQALNPFSSFSSPLYQNALQSTFNPMIRNFQQSIMPSISRQANGVGQSGSSREGIAAGIAAQGLQQNMSDIASQFAQNAFNQGIGSRDNALGQASQLGQFSFMPSLGMQDVGAQRQALNQQYINSPFDFASRLKTLMGDPTVLNENQSKSVSTGSQTESFNNVMSGIGKMFGGM